MSQFCFISFLFYGQRGQRKFFCFWCIEKHPRPINPRPEVNPAFIVFLNDLELRKKSRRFTGFFSFSVDEPRKVAWQVCSQLNLATSTEGVAIIWQGLTINYINHSRVGLREAYLPYSKKIWISQNHLYYCVYIFYSASSAGSYPKSDLISFDSAFTLPTGLEQLPHRINQSLLRGWDLPLLKSISFSRYKDRYFQANRFRLLRPVVVRWKQTTDSLFFLLEVIDFFLGNYFTSLRG